MSGMFQTGKLVVDNHGLLAYMHHMAQTARLGAVKRVFELFAQEEKQRIEENVGFRFPASGCVISKERKAKTQR